MTPNPISVALALLCDGFAVKLEHMPQTRIGLLTKALEDVPVRVLEPMVLRALKTRTPRYVKTNAAGEP